VALRILWHPQDAEDASQEILVRVVTRLAQFDFESRLKTWVYRVATEVDPISRTKSEES
jgi:DNA-directed RNA polymerase specialized sigma24 family protein